MNVSARLLRAVALAQSTEESRYYLCGVHVEPHPDGGVILVATNGHVMTVARDPDGTCDAEAIYPITKKALADLKGKADRAVIADGMLTILDQCGGVLGMHVAAPIDGTFPEWRRVLSEMSDNTETQAFVVEYLDRLNQTAKTLGALIYTICHRSTPALVKYAEIHEVFSAIMPCRSDGDSCLPSWAIAK